MVKNDQGLLVVISGPSGVGKGTICKEYFKQHEDAFLSVSATTRSPRDGEVDGEFVLNKATCQTYDRLKSRGINDLSDIFG